MVMERLDAAGKHPENQDSTKQFAIKQAKRLLRAANVKDPGPKEPLKRRSARRNEVDAQDSLSQAIVEYKSQPYNPEVVTKTFEAIWQARGESVELSFEIIPCPYSAEDLARLEKEGKRVAFVPENLSTQKDRYILGRMFPKMQSHSVREDNTVTNEDVRHGWFDYEAAIDAPYTNTTEDQLRETFANQGREGLNTTEYAIAGQDSKLFTGKYLDQVRTYVRLLGSRGGGVVVSADFNSDGSLNVGWSLDPRSAYGSLGGRSRGVKKA